MALPASEADTIPRLNLSRLVKRLGDKLVVNGIDLAVDPGECVVLLGPSGCGKTTTLRMVAGFIDPDEGEIHIEGRLTAGRGASIPTERRQLGMVFQSYAVWPHKSVFDNIAFGLKVAGHDRDTVKRKVHQVLELVQLGALAGRFPGELSGGQQQRVALARAVVMEPNLLLFDEPLSNLDAGLREELRGELQRLHADKGITMLYVTHDQQEALALADRIAVMNAGRIEQFDSPEAVYRRPRSRFVANFVGTANLLEGRIVAKDGNASRLGIEIDDCGTFLAKANRDFISSSRIGDRAAIVIRPEDLDLAPEGSGFAVTIKEVTFLGDCYEVSLEAAGKRLRARTRRRPAARDAKVVATPDPETIWAVP
ncbi:ABC-type Fe3+/spermidine/putrescine transport system ATPase subunit [Rhizobium sp. BK313]|uniref:ABC transporter ATP-binding protein n=1 Tax=Rhizobium sp. BK313 TaxID=2587081 RepID=UPI00105CB094|nr:ABC transporter ATP-binding protein [Rhizobium sp. BK313]MBB3458782.1 ABC-type Fe3+/spermidine/putrescine transport system ATPase subunit [Rhizobium sp. BK313]